MMSVSGVKHKKYARELLNNNLKIDL